MREAHACRKDTNGEDCEGVDDFEQVVGHVRVRSLQEAPATDVQTPKCSSQQLGRTKVVHGSGDGVHTNIPGKEDERPMCTHVAKVFEENGILPSLGKVTVPQGFPGSPVNPDEGSDNTTHADRIVGNACKRQSQPLVVGAASASQTMKMWERVHCKLIVRIEIAHKHEQAIVQQGCKHQSEDPIDRSQGILDIHASVAGAYALQGCVWHQCENLRNWS
mmetsp:Transcript_47649/g.113207  ORF Transcript_47649/g.113207 Transcript_47649/m.113207 type:complete len:219 (+) Transcript_47649:849-1505(+)